MNGLSKDLERGYDEWIKWVLSKNLKEVKDRGYRVFGIQLTEYSNNGVFIQVFDQVSIWVFEDRI
jgi:hypothetical protein